jgi:HEPN domain-containing protein
MERENIVILNSFATECFRNVADEDYISARVNYKLGLINQFQWCALQAIEKYLKAILLYNQISAKGLGHNLEKCLERVMNINEFELDIEDYEKKLIIHLDRNAQNRYLEQPAYTVGKELLHLDSTVWSLRRYCQSINYEITNSNGDTVNLLDSTITNITSEYYKNNHHKFMLIGGFLESVLNRKRNDELRKSLIWKNFKYGKQRKNIIKNFTFKSSSYVPPYVREPNRINVLSEYVDFPKRIKRIFSEL